MCERADDGYGFPLGIHGKEWLDADGYCAECGVVYPSVHVCHVCGGQAAQSNPWRSLGVKREPRTSRLVPMVQTALVVADVDFKKSCRPRRGCVRRLARATGMDTPYYRRFWNETLAAYQAGTKRGLDVGQWERMKPKDAPAGAPR